MDLLLPTLLFSPPHPRPGPRMLKISKDAIPEKVTNIKTKLGRDDARTTSSRSEEEPMKNHPDENEEEEKEEGEKHKRSRENNKRRRKPQIAEDLAVEDEKMIGTVPTSDLPQDRINLDLSATLVRSLYSHLSFCSISYQIRTRPSQDSPMRPN